MSEPILPIDLSAATEELVAKATQSASGRATRVFRATPGGSLSQVMLVLLAGRELSEHENPGQALLHVLSGRTRMIAGEDEWELPANTHIVIPDQRHSLIALEDSVVLLTVVKGDAR